MRTRHGRLGWAMVAGPVLATGVIHANLPSLAQAQTPSSSERTIIGVAEITANDVYVRSGDSLNHYTICKLRAGDRVTIVGERGEWYEILPPEGTFSLISGDYVDSADNQKGVVNGNNVRVRAGSLLNENKYTVQTLLSKGDEVTILGRNPDGFLRIQPPPGATVWVNRAFAQLISGTPTGQAPSGSGDSGASAGSPEARNERTFSTTNEGLASGSSSSGSGAPPVSSPAVVASSRPASTRTAGGDRLRSKLDALDAGVRGELAKPLGERQFDALLTGYREVAAEGDEFLRQYAERRIAEVETAMEAAEAFRQFRKLDEIADAKRREFRTARAAIPETAPLLPGGIEVKGELRTSVLFPPGSPTVRYRLVDPTAAGGRTVGYVEIPADSSIKVADFLGRYVGVRALERRVQQGGVDPVPIYVAGELIPLEAP